MRPIDSANAPAQSGTVDAEVSVISDSKGRKITLRNLSVIEEMRLLKVLGEYNSSYYHFCSQVARVAAFDGHMIPVPNSEREIESVAARLGKEGVAALMGAIMAEAQQGDDAEKEQVKK